MIGKGDLTITFPTNVRSFRIRIREHFKKEKKEEKRTKFIPVKKNNHARP